MRTITMIFDNEYHTYVKEIELEDEIRYIIVHTKFNKWGDKHNINPIVYDEKPSYDVLKNTHQSYYKKDLEYLVD
jgi:hypothetical protein